MTATVTIPEEETVNPTGAITGFAAYTTDTSQVSLASGTNYSITLDRSMFEFDGSGDATLTKAKLDAAGITATSNNSAFTASIVDNNGTLYLQATHNNSTLGTLPVQLSLTSSTLKSSLTLYNGNIVVRESNSASNNTINGIDSNAQLGYTANGIYSQIRHNGKVLSGGDATDLELSADDEIIIDFDSDFFTWANGKPVPAVNVSSSMIRSGKITVKTLNGKNTSLVDKVEIAYNSGRAYIRVKLVEKFVSTKEKDISLTVALAYNGSVSRDTAIEIAGTMDNDIVEVYKGEDYIDLSNGEIAEAQDSISRIDVDIGEGVVIRTKMTKGKKYYGSVDTEPTSSDNSVMRKYPDIDYVYTLNTVGLNQSGATVTIDIDDRYHVYDRNMNYLGTTSQRLPYSTKYYLASRKLNVTDDSSGSSSGGSSSGSGSGVVEVGPGSTGSGTGSPGGNSSNPHSNPQNGR